MQNKHQASKEPIHLDDTNDRSLEPSGASGVEFPQTLNDTDIAEVRENAHDTEMFETEQPPILDESGLTQRVTHEQNITDE